MKFKITDFPDHLQRQIQQKLNADTPAPVRPTVQQPKTMLPSAKEPNKTESAYRRDVLTRDQDIMCLLYEGMTFRLANGHRYTPDWIAVTKAGRLTCHEVKGSYRLGSYQRARLAFDQAAVEFPWVSWVWAERDKDHGWNIKTAKTPKGA